jgi:sec-independent protein translocase protein TatA
MGSLSFSHILLVVVVVLLVFGAGRLPRLMGDLAKGLKSFRDGMKDEEPSQSTSAPVLTEKPTVKKQAKSLKSKK